MSPIPHANGNLVPWYLRVQFCDMDYFDYDKKLCENKQGVFMFVSELINLIGNVKNTEDEARYVTKLQKKIIITIIFCNKWYVVQQFIYYWLATFLLK